MATEMAMASQRETVDRPRWNRLTIGFAAAVILFGAMGWVWSIVSRHPTGSTKISVQARNTDIREVLQDIASQSGAVLALDPKLQGKVSIRTKDAKLADLMNNFCEAYSCSWSLAGGSEPALVVQQAPPPRSDRPRG